MNFTADILNAISASDIDFVFVFMHNGKMYRVTVLRGTVIDFSGHVYEGPLFVGQILGTTEEMRNLPWQVTRFKKIYTRT